MKTLSIILGYCLLAFAIGYFAGPFSEAFFCLIALTWLFLVAVAGICIFTVSKPTKEQPK